MTTDPSLPNEMRDLLIRLDTKVDGLIATIARMDQRADGHEQRLQSLEQSSASRAALVAQHHDNVRMIGALDKRLSEIETTGRISKAIAVGLWTIIAGGGATAIAAIAGAFS